MFTRMMISTIIELEIIICHWFELETVIQID
jgi:hypothetical protein